MKVILKAFLPDAGYFDREEGKNFTDIEFQKADSNKDDIEIVVDSKRYWVDREELKKLTMLLID
jgi:hypothetical protein